MYDNCYLKENYFKNQPGKITLNTCFFLIYSRQRAFSNPKNRLLLNADYNYPATKKIPDFPVPNFLRDFPLPKKNLLFSHTHKYTLTSIYFTSFLFLLYLFFFLTHGPRLFSLLLLAYLIWLSIHVNCVLPPLLSLRLSHFVPSHFQIGRHSGKNRFLAHANRFVFIRRQNVPNWSSSDLFAFHAFFTKSFWLTSPSKQLNEEKPTTDRLFPTDTDHIVLK